MPWALMSLRNIGGRIVEDFEIVKTANGWMVMPHRNVADTYGRGEYLNWRNCHVFADEKELAAWIRKECKPKDESK